MRGPSIEPSTFQLTTTGAPSQPTQICRRRSAIVLLAGSTARFNAHRQDWDGGILERDLALQMLKGASFDQANSAAIKIISAHWREIAGKELEPQPGGNVREANSDGRKEAMCAVV